MPELGTVSTFLCLKAYYPLHILLLLSMKLPMTLAPELLLLWPAGLVHKEGKSHIGFGAKEARRLQSVLHHLLLGSVSPFLDLPPLSCFPYGLSLVQGVGTHRSSRLQS